eukprot:COSAG01_NODE_19178_length_1025_cov_417.899568_2_plen_61_part_00
MCLRKLADLWDIWGIELESWGTKVDEWRMAQQQAREEEQQQPAAAGVQPCKGALCTTVSL